MKKTLTLLALSLWISMIGFSQEDSKLSKDVDVHIFATKWVGTKYRFGGNSKFGIDCSGLSSKLYLNVFECKIPRTARDQYKATQRVKREDLMPGDLVFFRTRSRTGWHVGVYLGCGEFVHAASRRSGVRIDNLESSYFRKTFLSGGRIV